MVKDDVLFGYRPQLFAEAQRTPVAAACRVFSVPRSTYYTSTTAPTDFLTTAVSELEDERHRRLWPALHTRQGVSQTLEPVNLASIEGVRIRIDAAQDYVLGPLDPRPPGRRAGRP